MTLIAFEGIDGAGKSTQIRRLSQWLESIGYRTTVTFEPTRGIYGRKIRKSVTRLSETEEREAFVLDRQEHVSTCITPDISAGKIVLTDRYYFSSMAYQGSRIAKSRGAESDDAFDAVLNELRQENEAFAPRPDILFIFDLSVEEAMNRIKSNRTTTDSFETHETLSWVKRAFERIDCIMRQYPDFCIIHIDASQDIDMIEKEIKAHVKHHLEK